MLACFQEKAELLKKWVQCQENLQACEGLVRASRTSNLRGKKVVKLVSVKDMPFPPYSFCELAAC